MVTRMSSGLTALKAAADAFVTAVTMATVLLPSATWLLIAVTLTRCVRFQLDVLNVTEAGATLAQVVLLDVKVMVTGVTWSEGPAWGAVPCQTGCSVAPCGGACQIRRG